MKKILKIAISLSLVCIIFTSGVWIGTKISVPTNTTSTEETGEQTSTFTDPQQSVSLEYPASWVVEYPEKQTSNEFGVYIHPNDEKNSKSFDLYISPANGTLDEIMNERFALEEKEQIYSVHWNTKVGNEQAIGIFSYEIFENNENFQNFEQFFIRGYSLNVVRNGKLFSFSFHREDFENSELSQLIKSIKFL